MALSVGIYVGNGYDHPGRDTSRIKGVRNFPRAKHRPMPLGGFLILGECSAGALDDE